MALISVTFSSPPFQADVPSQESTVNLFSTDVNAVEKGIAVTAFLDTPTLKKVDRLRLRVNSPMFSRHCFHAGRSDALSDVA